MKHKSRFIHIEGVIVLSTSVCLASVVQAAPIPVDVANALTMSDSGQVSYSGYQTFFND